MNRLAPFNLWIVICTEWSGRETLGVEVSLVEELPLLVVEEAPLVVQAEPTMATLKFIIEPY